MPKPRIISAGNFSRGMMPDQIGARDSAAMIMDGVVDRAGEVRLRGAKANLATVTDVVPEQPFCGASLSPSTPIGEEAATDHKELLGFGSRNANSGELLLYLSNDAGSTFTSVDDVSIAAGSGAFASGSVGERYSCAAVGSELVFGPNTPALAVDLLKWSGSTAADYSTGTVSTTASSTTITGSGTNWQPGVQIGQYIQIYNATGNLQNRYFRIVGIETDTSLVVDQAPDETRAGCAYVITSVGQTRPAEIAGNMRGRVVGSYQGRLLLADTIEQLTVSSQIDHIERIRYSALPDETFEKFKGIDYFEENAYLDLYPGVGGRISGFVPVGGSVMVFKEGALFNISGDLDTTGTDLGARSDVVSGDVGCPSTTGFALTPLGLVWANRDGVWLLSGSSVTSLTEGKVGSVYREKASSINDVFITVSSIGDRIVVQLAAGANTFVFDTQRGTWTMQSVGMYSKVLRVRTSSGISRDVGGWSANATTARFDNWLTDITASGGTDSGATTTPALKLVTQPIELSDGGLPVGRPSAVYVDGFIREAASTDPYIAVSLLYGASGADSGEESAVALAKTITEGTYEDVHRIPVDAGDAKRRRQVRVVLESEVGSGECKVYGVWLAATAAETVGP